RTERHPVSKTRPALTPFVTLSLVATAVITAGGALAAELFAPSLRPYLLPGGGVTAALLVTALAVMVIRRRTGEAQATEVKFQTLLDAAPDAIVIVNRDGKIVLVNSQTEQMFGFAREELLGKSFDDLVHQE